MVTAEQGDVSLHLSRLLAYNGYRRPRIINLRGAIIEPNASSHGFPRKLEGEKKSLEYYRINTCFV